MDETEERFYVMPHWDLRGKFVQGPFAKPYANLCVVGDPSLKILTGDQFQELRERIARLDREAADHIRRGGQD